MKPTFQKGGSSILKKQKWIAHYLQHFPASPARSQSSSIIAQNLFATLQITRNLPKRKPSLKRGKSLETESKKEIHHPSNFIKKTMENGRSKESPLKRKKMNKNMKQNSFSRVSLGSSQQTLSIPSSKNLNPQAEIMRLKEENKTYKETIEKQLKHIRSLEILINQI